MDLTSEIPDTVPMRDARDEEVPASAARLAKLATEHGWTVRLVYARGTGYKRTPTDSVTVRCTREDKALVGQWVDGAFRNGLRTTPAPFVLDSRALRAAVTDV